MSTPKFVRTIFAKMEVRLDSTRHKVFCWKCFVAMVTLGNFGFPNYNPIVVAVCHEIVSIRLAWCGDPSELWHPSIPMDSHDLKMRERFNLIVHNNTLS